MSHNIRLHTSDTFIQKLDIYPDNNLLDNYKNIGNAYKALSFLKLCQQALTSNQSINLEEIERAEEWERILNIEEYFKVIFSSNSDITRSFTDKLSVKISNLAKLIFNYDKSCLTEGFTNAIRNFPLRNKEDIHCLLISLQSIQKGESSTSMRGDRIIQDAIKKLIAAYEDDSLCTAPEIFALYQKECQEIAAKKIDELSKETNQNDLLKKYQDIEAQKTAEKSIREKLSDAMKREIKEREESSDDVPYTREQFQGFLYDAGFEINDDDFQSILNYLKERGISFAKFVSLDVMVCGHFLIQFGEIITVNDTTMGSGPVGVLMMTGVTFEELTFSEEPNKDKALLILENMNSVLKLCQHPSDIPFRLLAEQPLEKLQLLIQYHEQVVKIRKTDSNKGKLYFLFLTILPTSMLKSALQAKNIDAVISAFQKMEVPKEKGIWVIFSEVFGGLFTDQTVQDEYRRKFIIINILRRSAIYHRDSKTYLEEFEKLPEDQKEAILSFKEIILPKEYGMGDDCSFPLLQYLTTIYGIPLTDTIQITKLYTAEKLSKTQVDKYIRLIWRMYRVPTKNRVNFLAYIHDLDKLKHLEDDSLHKLASLAKHYPKERKDIDMVVDNIDVALLFEGSEIDLDRLADLEAETWQELRCISELSPHAFKKISATQFEFLIGHTTEIRDLLHLDINITLILETIPSVIKKVTANWDHFTKYVRERMSERLGEWKWDYDFKHLDKDERQELIELELNITGEWHRILPLYNPETRYSYGKKLIHSNGEYIWVPDV